MDKGLLTCERADPNRSEPAWHSQCTNFENGETVFTNNVNWLKSFTLECSAIHSKVVNISAPTSSWKRSKPY